LTDDPLSAALEEFWRRHQQFKTGICYRDNQAWPCDATRLRSALEVIRQLHHRSIEPLPSGQYYCMGCLVTIVDGAEKTPVFTSWPCAEYRDVLAALTDWPCGLAVTGP